MSQHFVHPVEDSALPLPVLSDSAAEIPLLCFSHLRWDFVYQRPQHLMSRFASSRRVYFIEEPVIGAGPARLDIVTRDRGIRVVVPHIPGDPSSEEMVQKLQQLISKFVQDEGLSTFTAWYYTPMMLSWTGHLRASVTIYDCMDELSLFRGAPPAMLEWEHQLLERAHLVLTGGMSLFQSKCGRHSNVHCFPSSVDYAHFSPARMPSEEPTDQNRIPHVRLGFAGVIDERMDTKLLDAIAVSRPEWHFVLIGPVVKIDPAQLPRRKNIHYLGSKPYADLPAYLSGWDVALMPFAKNEATRFISPTKTPEYLSAGLGVVSTSIHDVVHPYGSAALVEIADSPEEFCAAIERILARSDEERHQWLTRVDGFLSTMSWDRTHNRMSKLIAEVAEKQKDQRPHISESVRAWHTPLPLTTPEQGATFHV